MRGNTLQRLRECISQIGKDLSKLTLPILWPALLRKLCLKESRHGTPGEEEHQQRAQVKRIAADPSLVPISWGIAIDKLGRGVAWIACNTPFVVRTHGPCG